MNAVPSPFSNSPSPSADYFPDEPGELTEEEERAELLADLEIEAQNIQDSKDRQQARYKLDPKPYRCMWCDRLAPVEHHDEFGEPVEPSMCFAEDSDFPTCEGCVTAGSESRYGF